MSQRTPEEVVLDVRGATGVGLPSVGAYIASLPEGWRSYAECEARAGLLASLEPTGVLDELRGLPIVGDHVNALATAAWIPEVAHPYR